MKGEPVSEITVLAVGDVTADLPDNGPSFRHVKPLFAKGDVVFGNCEYVYSDEVVPSVTHIAMHSAPPKQAAEFEIFDVMSVANNHALDGGEPGLFGTMKTLEDLGVKPVGAGRNLSEAQAPAVIEVDGKRVAFVAFCSAFPRGYEARTNRSGLSPLRVHNFYRDPYPNFWDAGITPVIETVPLQEDVDNYRRTIQAAREVADYVLVSHHWGNNPEVRNMMAPGSKTHDIVWKSALEDYELQLARLGIDFGADAILAHHQTSLNGVEIRAGKPIFYGLAALVHHFHNGGSKNDDSAIATRTNGIEGYPHWAFKKPETLITGIAVLRLSEQGISAGIVPAMILPDGGVEPLKPGDDRVEKVASHVEAKIALEDLGTVVKQGTFDEWALLEIHPA